MTASTLPPSVGSPSPFFTHKDDATTRQHDGTVAERSWVVAYGFTNERERQELLSILKGRGQILAIHWNASNWIAVQYPDELCAARASAKQIVPVCSVLCGISRVTGSFVQELLSRSGKSLESSLSSSPSGVFDTSSDAVTSAPIVPSVSLVEEDILVGYNTEKSMRNTTAGFEVANAPHARGGDSSWLVRAIYYYFGWNSYRS
jgi:hypothetical protein